MYMKYCQGTRRFSKELSHRVVRRQFARCKDCSYAASGFICWHSDGTCIKTDYAKIMQRIRETNMRSGTAPAETAREEQHRQYSAHDPVACIV